MKVFIDGEEVQFQNDVKVVFEDETLDVMEQDDTFTDVTGDLHVTVNNEGVILDAVENNEVSKTASIDTEDLISLCK
jgi:hypothetical protein